MLLNAEELLTKEKGDRAVMAHALEQVAQALREGHHRDVSLHVTLEDGTSTDRHFFSMRPSEYQKRPV